MTRPAALVSPTGPLGLVFTACIWGSGTPWCGCVRTHVCVCVCGPRAWVDMEHAYGDATCVSVPM